MAGRAAYPSYRRDRRMSALERQVRAEMREHSRFPRVWFDAISDTATSDYQIKGLIDQKSLTLVYGPSGGGKTFFAIDLAARIGCGLPWRGRRTRQGLVVYVAAEAGESIGRRFKAWRDHYRDRSIEGSTKLAIITRAPNLLRPEDVDALMETLRDITDEAETPLALVVFDTLSRSMPGGDENSAKDMSSVIAVADRIRDELKSSTLIVHHSGKDAAKGVRGHSALFAAADAVLSVADRVITVEKSRDGVDGETFGFDLAIADMGNDSDGDPVTTCVLVPTNTERKKRNVRSLPGAARVANTALREVITEHGQLMPETSTIPGGVKAVEIAQWRERFRVRYGSDERGGRALRQAFQRGREHLLKERLIAVSDPYVWMTQ